MASGDRSPNRLPAPQRRAQLLDVALREFSQRGFHDTSMDTIAQAAGVTKPVLYQHFDSKRELFLELLRDVGGQLRDAVAKATADASGPREQVGDGMRAYVHWVDEHRAGFELLFAGDVRRDTEFRHEAAAVEREMASAIGALIVVDGLDAERRRLLGYGIVGLSEATCRRWLAHDLDLTALELADQVASLAWAGLRGLRAT